MRAIPIGAVLLTSLAQSPALAAPPSPQAPKPKSSLQEVSAMLSSHEADQVRTALERAALLPPKQVLPAVEARVREGLTPVLLDVAIDTVLLLNDPSAGSLLDDLTRHRRPAVRRRALDAVAQLRVRGAEALLARGVDDQDADVRSTAVDGLGAIGARGSFALVLRAHEMGVEGSALALGRLADPTQVGRLLDLVGERPLEALVPMIDALFARRDLPDADKLRMVERLAEVGTDPARNLLAEQLKKLPAQSSAKLKQALAEAAQGAKGAQ
ncbi:MAG: HEAT repeat domain-containing protein [Polyangiales bacterium]